MSQADLFAALEPTALQVWWLAPPCSFGIETLAGSVHAPGWDGPHHCLSCAVEVARGCAQFAADVRAGKFDADGYTPAERRAQQKRKQGA